MRKTANIVVKDKRWTANVDRQEVFKPRMRECMLSHSVVSESLRLYGL